MLSFSIPPYKNFSSSSSAILNEHVGWRPLAHTIRQKTAGRPFAGCVLSIWPTMAALCFVMTMKHVRKMSVNLKTTVKLMFQHQQVRSCNFFPVVSVFRSVFFFWRNLHFCCPARFCDVVVLLYGLTANFPNLKANLLIYCFLSSLTQLQTSLDLLEDGFDTVFSVLY